MNTLIFENMLLKTSDKATVYRVLWLSEDREVAYLFNVLTMSVPEAISYNALCGKISDGTLVPQTDDPYVKLIAETEINDRDRDIRDNIWSLMSETVAAEPDIYVRKLRAVIVANLVNKSGKHLKNLYDYLKTYWKHGKSKNAFLPNYGNCGGRGKERATTDKKRGRPRKYDDAIGVNIDAPTKAIFEKSIKHVWIRLRHAHNCRTRR